LLGKFHPQGYARPGLRKHPQPFTSNGNQASPMNCLSPRNARFYIGTIEPGARGLILRDADGVCWRLSFADACMPPELLGKVSIRGRLTGPDRIEVEYFSRLADS